MPSIEAVNDRARLRAKLTGIYALVEPDPREPLTFVAALLAGGVRLFQIRAKGGISVADVTAVVALVRSSGGMTLVNDDVDLARAADGVHLGQEDAARYDTREVRQRLASRIIGLSCGTPAEARDADPELVDYIGCGPLFATGSKSDAGRPIGVCGVRAVAAATALPIAAIGGITLDRLTYVRETGATMVAVVSALSAASDVAATARAFVAAWSA